ncbi:hypothetical protein F5876DRAFT_65180 [Lentinula aff. lateritia]|uniref:Uncharacterized protein n=1 Tax=Lentinula aff. lateritia TaxID=2804960 RepID=A0ACC1U1Y4_9AGAR|nr:hypothetical protein F5876DRAFT_65180 [Lentinula aff. lateritia]
MSTNLQSILEVAVFLASEVLYWNPNLPKVLHIKPVTRQFNVPPTFPSRVLGQITRTLIPVAPLFAAKEHEVTGQHFSSILVDMRGGLKSFLSASVYGIFSKTQHGGSKSYLATNVMHLEYYLFLENKLCKQAKYYVASACPVTVLASTTNVRGHSLEPISPSLHGRDSASNWNKSVLRLLGGKGARIPKTCVQARPGNDPSDGKLMGFGFTHASNGHLAREGGQLSDFYLSRPKGQHYDDLVLYRRPVLPNRNPVADPQCVVYADKRQIDTIKPEKTVLIDKPSKSLPSNFIAYYKDKEQGIDDTVMQISQQLAMQLRLRAVCLPSECDNAIINHKPLPEWSL